MRRQHRLFDPGKDLRDRMSIRPNQGKAGILKEMYRNRDVLLHSSRRMNEAYSCGNTNLGDHYHDRAAAALKFSLDLYNQLTKENVDV